MHVHQDGAGTATAQRAIRFLVSLAKLFAQLVSTISDKTSVYCQLEFTYPLPGQAHVRSRVEWSLHDSFSKTGSIDGHHQIFAGVEQATQIVSSPKILRSGACDCAMYTAQDMVTGSRDKAARG